jgi:ribosomal protein S18 acetylase RimI-like enzyme
MTQDSPKGVDLDLVEIRLARPEDHASVREIFRKGCEDGQVRNNDTGADIDNLHEGYFSDDGDSGFWVASIRDDVIGMIGVQKTSDNKAEIRRLRVCERYRRMGLGTRLMAQAMQFCKSKGYLKVVLDVQIDRGPAIALFEKSGFTLGRTREINGRKMVDFYLDLYRESEA